MRSCSQQGFPEVETHAEIADSGGQWLTKSSSPKEQPSPQVFGSVAAQSRLAMQPCHRGMVTTCGECGEYIVVRCTRTYYQLDSVLILHVFRQQGHHAELGTLVDTTCLACSPATRPPLLLTLRSQLNRAATEGEIYRYVAHTFKAFQHAFHALTKERGVKTGETLCEAERDGRSDRVRPSEKALLLRKEISNSLGVLLGNGGCPDFEPLELAIDR